MKAFISSEQAFLFILHINAEVWIKLVQIDEFGFGVYFCGPSHKQKIPKSLDFRL